MTVDEGLAVYSLQGGDLKQSWLRARATQASTQTVKYYDFTIDGAPVGYLEVSESPSGIYMNAVFIVEGHRQANPFWVFIVDGVPTHCRTGEKPWREVPDGVYPSSAFPIVLRQRLARYRRMEEATGRIDDVELAYDGESVVETVRGAADRRFCLNGDDIVWVCWGGGAESRLKESRAQALAGTLFE